jgi:hypothetical protein
MEKIAFVILSEAKNVSLILPREKKFFGAERASE